MGYSRLIVEKGEDHVATVTLNRPEKMNAFDSPLAEELLAAFMELDSCSATRVVLVKGAGRNFCAGIDVSEITGKNALEYKQWVSRMESPLFFISRMKKPVIAQVHGVAAANGLGLAAAADLVIAAEDARMGLTAINLGLNCVGPVLPVVRCVGRKRALELLLSGALVKAPEAMTMGLVNRVVPADELEKEAREWAAAFASKSPLALQLAKSAFYTAEDMEYEKQFAYMDEVFARLCTTGDAHEGVKAFFEKREPLWRGR
ncbi:MAG: enoyl-CoA hydratase-related protein [Thermovirgaceae bacterium]|nr:enoyl-CoA hydratase-related protein [Synergistales bacterium]HPC75847.1 enoyl-CoA hydratase-related protein [Synergistales bacterium]HRS48595.1 enoyl-CoA hydratase-related protein [Thermovirgaceae bacterium]HRU90816.1 enoyl-CoA hydratase-related protein [Thermovirgaceae bacterium]